MLVVTTNGHSLLVWVDLILASQIRSQMNSVFWFFWFTRWVKQQQQGKILWCKRCTITLHIIQQSTRWPQPVNILDCIDWPSLHMSPSRPLADKCLLAILTQHKLHSFFKLLGIWCVAFNFRVDFLLFEVLHKETFMLGAAKKFAPQPFR